MQDAVAHRTQCRSPGDSLLLDWWHALEISREHPLYPAPCTILCQYPVIKQSWSGVDGNSWSDPALAAITMHYSAMVLPSVPCCQVSSSSDTVPHLSSSSPRTRTRWPSEVEEGVSSSEDVCSSSSQQCEDQEEEGSVSSTVPV